MATPNHIVDVPLDDDGQQSEAGSPVKAKADTAVKAKADTAMKAIIIKPNAPEPISLKLAALLWVVCSTTIALLDIFQDQASDYTRLALTAITVGLILASILYLAYYAFKWSITRGKQETLAGSTPFEVAAAQGILYV